MKKYRAKKIYNNFDDFSVITVSIGYNRFLPEWAESVSKLNTKPRAVIIGIDQIEKKLKAFIEEKISNVKWIYLKKINSRHFSHYYNLLVKQVKTTWVCKIDVDDLIFPDSYDELYKIKEDIYAFGNQSSISKQQYIPPRIIKSIDFLRANTNLISSLSPFRKSVWEKNNYKDYIFDDWIFWIDASIENFTFKSSNRINYIYREHIDQATKKIDEHLERSEVLTYKRNRLIHKLKNDIEIQDNENYLIIEPLTLNQTYFLLLGELLNRMSFLRNSNILILRSHKITKYHKYYEHIYSKLNYNVLELDQDYYFSNKTSIKNILKTTSYSKIDKVFFLNNSLGEVKKFNNLSNFDYDIFVLDNKLIKIKSLKSKKHFFAFYVQKIKNRSVLNNYDLVTNLPIYFYFEFQKINKGYSKAIKFISQKRSRFYKAALQSLKKIFDS